MSSVVSNQNHEEGEKSFSRTFKYSQIKRQQRLKIHFGSMPCACCAVKHFAQVQKLACTAHSDVNRFLTVKCIGSGEMNSLEELMMMAFLCIGFIFPC